MIARQILAFLKKDFLMESSYKLPFVFNIFGVLISVASYFFIDKLFGQKIAGHMQEFGVNYFSYVLLSMAFFSYIGVGLGSFSARIQSEQIQGTLEAVLLTPAKLWTILLAMGLWNLIFASFDLGIYILLGVFLFKINFAAANILSTIVILALTIASFSALGILSASFVMVFKRGNPVGWIINNLEGLLGGVYFPVTVLPAWLQVIAGFFPITYAIRAIQLAVYKGYSLHQLQKETMFLLFFSLILLPLSMAAFRRAIEKAKKNGSLGQY